MFVREANLKQTVRSIVGATEARRVLKHITDGNADITANWKARAEQNEIAIERGSPLELANVYMGLSRIRHEGGSLRAVDRKHLEVSGQALSEELSAALGKPRRQIQRMMEEPYSVDDRGDSKNY
jgi:RNA polymerase-interacting CarD/CdnL/TRCF family regulator